MFFSLEKFKNRVEELGLRRYADMKDIFPFTSMEDSLDTDMVHTYCPEEIMGPDMDKNAFFTGRDRYCWLRKKVTMPEKKDGFEVVGLFDFGKTGGGFNSGFESLLFVDREPWQGVDTYHNDVVFEELAGKDIELSIMLWTGLEGGGEHQTHFHQCKTSQIGYLHRDADVLYYYAWAVAGALEQISEDEPVYHALESLLNQSLLRIDWTEGAFFNSVSGALSFFEEGLSRIEKRTDCQVTCVGHTHIDVAWLWRLKHTREKAIRSFSTVLRLMNEFDDYIFLQSQPQIYKYIKSDYPEIYEKMKKRIAENRWEPDGGMWLEADCNISSGEALVRQLLHGCNFFKEEFGKASEFLWLPDVFGYSWALPQILKQCNIKSFVTTKISWNQYNRMPHDLFKWRGMDGTEIVTYFITAPIPGAPKESFFATYNAEMVPEVISRSWKNFRDKAISPEVLISYGHGDGGGGVTRDMLKMRRAMDKIPGLPAVKTGRVDEFLQRAHENIEKTNSYVHTWDGELYLEYHRGTYTSQAKNKKWNRKLELKLAQTEWIAVLGIQKGAVYPAPVFHDGWETVLRNQFHDIIPGSSIREVYEDSDKEYEHVDMTLEQVRGDIFKKLTASKENMFTAYNFGSFPRTELIFVPVEEDGHFEDGFQNKCISQMVPGGYWVQTDILPLSAAAVIFVPGEKKKEENPFAASMETGELTTPYYKVRWDKNGNLVSLYDKEDEKEVLSGPANVLEIFEDKPIQYDAWDIDIFYEEKKEIFRMTGTPEVTEQGPLRIVLRFCYEYHLSKIIQDVVFYADKRRIDFQTRVDWQETQKLLKAAFPVSVRNVKATYDIQFGHVERPTHFNTSWDYARFEVVGHKWADLSETHYGVALINDCKYGYNIRDNVMKISLLKSAIYPDTAADKGEQIFTYALLPHTGALPQSRVIEESIELNLPSVVVPGEDKAAGKCLFALDNTDIHIDAVKKAESGGDLILRFHECRGGSSSFTITSDYKIRSYAPCNLLEERTGEKMTSDSICGEIKPFEIQSYRIEMEVS